MSQREGRGCGRVALAHTHHQQTAKYERLRRPLAHLTLFRCEVTNIRLECSGTEHILMLMSQLLQVVESNGFQNVDLEFIGKHSKETYPSKCQALINCLTRG